LNELLNINMTDNCYFDYNIVPTYNIMDTDHLVVVDGQLQLKEGDPSVKRNRKNVNSLSAIDISNAIEQIFAERKNADPLSAIEQEIARLKIPRIFDMSESMIVDGWLISRKENPELIHLAEKENPELVPSAVKKKHVRIEDVTPEIKDVTPEIKIQSQEDAFAKLGKLPDRYEWTIDKKNNIYSINHWGMFTATLRDKEKDKKGKSKEQNEEDNPPFAVCVKLYDSSSLKACLSHIYEDISGIQNMNHPNVIHSFGGVFDENTFGEMIEPIDGSIERFMKKNKITPELERKLITGVAAGLVHVHERGPCDCIHVKYIGVTADGTPKIMELGKTKRKMDAYKTPVGILEYRCLEIIKGNQRTNSGDVYSFSLLMWQILHYKYGTNLMTHMKEILGIRGVRDAEAIYKIEHGFINGHRPKIHEDIPKVYADIIKESWVDDPADRPTMENVHKRLLNYSWNN
jgi:hypothetical protein